MWNKIKHSNKRIGKMYYEKQLSCKKDQGWLPRQGEFVLKKDLWAEKGGRAFPWREQHGWRNRVVVTQSVRRAHDWGAGCGSEKWRRLSMFWNICLDQSLELLILHSPLRNYWLHVHGSYLLLAGSGHFLWDGHKSSNFSLNASWIEEKGPSVEGRKKTQYQEFQSWVFGG